MKERINSSGNNLIMEARLSTASSINAYWREILAPHNLKMYLYHIHLFYNPMYTYSYSILCGPSTNLSVYQNKYLLLLYNVLFPVASHGAYGGSEETEEDGWCQWGRLVTDWDAQWKRKTAVIRDMVHRGVPHHFRPLVWQLLCHAEKAPEKKLYSNLLMVQSILLKNHSVSSSHGGIFSQRGIIGNIFFC